MNDKIIVNGAMLTEPNYNLPNINPAFFCKKYKYFYATGLFGLGVYRACVSKFIQKIIQALSISVNIIA